MPRHLFSLPFPIRTLSAGCYLTAPLSKRFSAVAVRHLIVSASVNFTNEKLIEEIRDAGGTPFLGGIEYAEDIVHHMDIDHAAQADDSLQRFVEDLRNILRSWRG